MLGPEIFCRTLSNTEIPDQFGNNWQYHSRSDNHSKIACWAFLFDLMLNCQLLVEHAAQGKVAFGINHEMRDFKTGRKKNLDLVICTPKSVFHPTNSMVSYAAKNNIRLTTVEQMRLSSLPTLGEAKVGSVFVAVEAKATMTAHIKALPRLHDELNSSHLAIHGAAADAIAVGLAFINTSPSFVSADRNKFDLQLRDMVISANSQPNATIRTIEKLREILRRNQPGLDGFDALAIVPIEFRNDRSPVVRVATDKRFDLGGLSYEDAVHRVANQYASLFANR